MDKLCLLWFNLNHCFGITVNWIWKDNAVLPQRNGQNFYVWVFVTFWKNCQSNGNRNLKLRRKKTKTKTNHQTNYNFDFKCKESLCKIYSISQKKKKIKLYMLSLTRRHSGELNPLTVTKTGLTETLWATSYLGEPRCSMELKSLALT